METQRGRIFPYPPKGEAPPEFGIEANVVKTKLVNLAAARVTPERLEIGGSVLWAVAATSYGALLSVRLNDQMRAPIPFQQGMYLRGIRFSRLYITNAAQPGETLTLLYATESVDNIQIENPAAAFALIDVTKATVFNSLVDLAIVGAAAAVAILPANAARRVAIFGNLAVSVNTLRIGDATCAANIGQELAPGDSIAIESTEAIFAYNPAGANVFVSRIWTED